MGNSAAGFIAALVAAVAFGSNYLPVKKYDMGNGMLFQLIMAIGIWTFGMFYTVIRSNTLSMGPWIHPLALLGGAIWNTGNILSVPIIKCIGMALGLAIWSATGMLVGWATGKWGLLGTPKDDSVKSPWLNYLGLGLVLSSLVLFLNVKPNNMKTSAPVSASSAQLNEASKTEEHSQKKDDIVAPMEVAHEITKEDVQKEQESLSSLLKEPWQRQVLGVGLSIIAGICYGTCICPIQYLITSHPHNRSDYPKNLQDYTHSHYSGILLTAILYFFIYAIATGNNPQLLKKQAILPIAVCGSVWGLAQICFFISVSMLGTQTAFPVVSGTPQIVASLWGVLLFKEVTGTRNIAMLSAAILVAFTGVLCIAFSKF